VREMKTTPNILEACADRNLLNVNLSPAQLNQRVPKETSEETQQNG